MSKSSHIPEGMGDSFVDSIFGNNTANKPKEEPKPEVNQAPVQAPVIEAPKPENPKPTEEITLESIENKFITQSFAISKRNLATIKVISKLTGKKQGQYLNEILSDFFKTQKYDAKIQEKIENEIKVIRD